MIDRFSSKIKVTKIIISLLLVASMLVACGDSSDSTGQESESVTTEATTKEITTEAATEKTSENDTQEAVETEEASPTDIVLEPDFPEVGEEVLHINCISSYEPDVQNAVDYFLNKYPEYEELIEIKSDWDYPVADSFYDDGGVVYYEHDYMIDYTDKLIDVEDVGITTDLYSTSYESVVNAGTFDGKLKMITNVCNPFGFFYKKEMAEEIFGTSDQEDIQALMSDWDGFIEVAESLNSEGKFILSNLDNLSNEYGTGLLDSNESGSDIISKLEACNAAKGDEVYSDAWYSDFENDEVFGFYGPLWSVWLMDSENKVDYGVCAGPQGFVAGGCYYAICDNCTNEGLAALFVYTICCEEEAIKYCGENQFNDGLPNCSSVALTVNHTDQVDKIVTVGNAYKAFDESAKMAE